MNRFTMADITEHDHASDQAGTFDQGPTSTIEAVEKWVSNEVMVKLLTQAGDKYLPTEEEIAKAVAHIEGRVDRSAVALALRAEKIAKLRYRMESERWANGQW